MTIVTGQPMNEILRNLFEIRRELNQRAKVLDEEVEKRTIAEATARQAYKLAHSTAFLAAQGSDRTKTAIADRDTIVLYGNLETATALRRSSQEAAKTLHHEIDALAALSHTANRSIKTEAAMGGFD